MTAAILGILSTIIPIVLDLVCDRITKAEKPSNKVESDVKRLNNVNDATSIAATFASHDDKLRRLLLRAKARKPKSKRSNSC